MATIDSRATVTCNLGEVISGGVSDSYLQGSGLVMTKGQLTLVGLKTPEIGSSVTVNYQMNGGSSGRIPRDLRVLSAFADPLRGTSEISLGCTLTYLDGVMPVPSLQDGRAAYVSPRQLECLNGLPKSAFPPPIMADDLFRYCLQKLGIACAAILKNSYVMDEYDLSGGYVQAIGNLLLSESKVGYIDETGGLSVIDLDEIPNGSISLTVDDIIDVSSINSGEQPATIAIVPYIDKKLETYRPEDAKWDQVETIGSPQSVTLKWSEGSTVVSHTPSTRTVTEYGEPTKLTDQCDLYEGGYGDLSNTVVRTTTERSTVLGQSSGGYATAVYEGGFNPGTSRSGLITEVTEYEFDAKDRPLRTTRSIYEPMFVYAGRMSLPWVLDEQALILGSEPVLAERSIEEHDYAGEIEVPTGIRPGVDMPDMVVHQRSHRYTYQAWGKTQGGSQAPAESTTVEAFETVAQVQSYINQSLGLILTNSEVTANKTFNPKGDTRPGEADRGAQQGTLDNAGRTTKYVELQFSSFGSDPRVVQYSPPHLTESYFSSGGFAVNVDCYAVSAAFGRAQHALTIGNRLGVNIQTTPDKGNFFPFSGVSINLKGYSGRFAANSLNYSFDANGILCSFDALFMGAEGSAPGDGSGEIGSQPWYYLPSGYDPDNLPEKDDGQVIKPFNEISNVQGGVALGLKAYGSQAQGLIPQTVELGVKIGVDGTNATIVEIVNVGVAVGIDGSAKTGVTNQALVGVKVGVNVEPDLNTIKYSTPGVRVGFNLGPDTTLPLLLMSFDDGADPWKDKSPNAWPFVNVNDSAYWMEPAPPEFDDRTYDPRFGAGAVMFNGSNPNNPVDSSWQGGLLSSGTGMELGTGEFTVEFWMFNDDYIGHTNQFRTYVSIKGTADQADSGWGGWSFGTKGAGTSTTNDGCVLFTMIKWNKPGSFYTDYLYDSSSAKLPVNEWVHVAFVKKLGVPGMAYPGSYNQIYMYINGVRVNTEVFGWQDIADNTFGGEQLALGYATDGSGGSRAQYAEWCMLDEIRITKGKAIYTEPSFSPPTGAF